MARSSVRFTNANFVTVEGVERMAARCAAIPEAVKLKLREALQRGATDLVGVLKATAPVSELDSHKGELREHIHAEPGPNISYDVIVDPPGKDGKGYSPHVEYGHIGPGGAHVPAEPFFWPAVRTERRRIRNQANRASAAGIRQAVGNGQ